MLALLHALRAALNLSSSPARVSRLLRGPDRQLIGVIDEVRETDGLEVRATLTPEGTDLLKLTSGPGAYSFGIPLHDSPDELIPWGPHEFITRGALAAALEDFAAPSNRRVAIADELHAADPRPDLERARALAEHAQNARPGHDEAEWAWRYFMDGGGATLTPWQAYKLGLAAVVDRLES